MRYLIRLFTLFFLISCSQFVFADGYWTVTGSSLHFPSADEGCMSLATSTYPLWRKGGAYGGSSRVFFCERFHDSTWKVVSNRLVQLYSTTCPSGTSYDHQSQKCSDPEPDECEEKAGESDFFSKSGDMDDGYTSIITVGGKKWVAAPQDGCMGGCKVSVTTDCKNRIGTNAYRCSGPATYTGESCTATDGSPQLEQEENYRSEEPTNTEKKEPCVYVTDAEGRSVCVSKQSLDREGQNCGTYNGVSLCRPKEATLDEKTVETEVKETTKPDGGKQIIKKDVATETKCTGSKKSCTTTTTTTTTTTNSDGSGTTTSTEVECKGANCGSGVGGGGAGNGSGEGEEGEEVGELEGQDEVAGFGESIQDFNSRISGAPILASVSSISMPRGGSCSMGSASVPLLGSISFNWVCQNANLLDPLYYVMLAVWAIAAVRVFLEA